MRPPAVLGLGLVLIAAAACNSTDPPPAPPAGPSSFTVTVYVTETPPTRGVMVSGATVAVNGTVAVSDDRGRVFVELQAPSRATVTREGYHTLTQQIAPPGPERLDLIPVFKLVDDTFVDQVESGTQNCPGGEALCRQYLLALHYDGQIRATMEWAHRRAAFVLQLRAGAPNDISGTYAIVTSEQPQSERRQHIEALVTGGAVYMLRVIQVGGPSPVPYTVRVQRPN